MVERKVTFMESMVPDAAAPVVVTFLVQRASPAGYSLSDAVPAVLAVFALLGT
jgi:hypothetical protein